MTDKNEWLNATIEEAIDPAEVIVDPHHHLWDFPTGTYLVPELHEDSEELGANIMQSGTQTSNINTGIYKVKRNSEKQKGPSKNEIIRERFGI